MKDGTCHGATGSCEPAFSERLKVNRRSANSSSQALTLCRALCYALEGLGGGRHQATERAPGGISGRESKAEAPRERSELSTFVKQQEGHSGSRAGERPRA